MYGFEKEFCRKVIATVNPKTFEEFIKVMAASHGTGAWTENGEKLFWEKKAGIKDLITSRDDVFEYLLSRKIDRIVAFSIAEAVRKGMIYKGISPKWPKWKKMLSEAGVPDWYIWSCEQIKYLSTRAHAIALAYIALREGVDRCTNYYL